MQAFERLENTLKKIGIPYQEERYRGKAESYITYVQESETETIFTDNQPKVTRTYFQVHYFCPFTPSADNSREVTKKLKKLLRSADFDITEVARRGAPEEKRHVIVECSILTKNNESEE